MNQGPSNAADPTGTVDVAVANLARLLARDPALAAEQAREILKAVPGHPYACLVLGRIARMSGQTQAALDMLEPLVHRQPHSAAVHLEFGIALGEASRASEAVAAFRRALQLQPDWPDAWRLLADHLDAMDDRQGADQARSRYLRAATQDARLVRAGAALVENNIPVAEDLLRSHLKANPTDVAALRMLAEVAARLRRYRDAQLLLERCLELAPSFDAARHNYASVLIRQAKSAKALPQVERLLAQEPRNPAYRNLQAAVLAHLGDYAESIGVYEAVLAEFPQQPKIWMSYGHALKTARRHDDSVLAYRRAIVLQPALGEAYWSLANLKTFRFSDSDVLAIRAALGREDLSEEERLHFEFALGKALEDAAAYEESFAHYVRGNAIRRKLHPYRRDDNRRFVSRSKQFYTADFFAARSAVGARSADPIFVLGLPRAGSTLLEQILASHSLVEGTMELPDMPMLAHELESRETSQQPNGYFQAQAALSAAELDALGERYLSGTQLQRKTQQPFFVDKMPNNWLYVGLIHLILPNAKIIDARRHPLGCCLSGFKQNFARGQTFSYGLEDIGQYYRNYVELMAHFDTVLPGRIHRVFYERMIVDTEAEVRRLLDFCGLPFEQHCLRFYENERAVRTASSEQVRQPIFTAGVDHWRHYEPWLGPLKEVLGQVLECYPAIPDFAPCEAADRGV